MMPVLFCMKRMSWYSNYLELDFSYCLIVFCIRYLAFFVGALVMGSAAIALAFFLVPSNSQNIRDQKLDTNPDENVSITSQVYK